MEALDILKRRIDTTRDLQAIVRTMKTLSAVTIPRCERASQAVRSYDRTVDLGLQIVLRDPEFAANAIRSAENAARKGPVGIIVLGSDHGLCGRFNDVVADRARKDIESVGTAQIRLAAVGMRVAEMLERSWRTPDEDFSAPGSVTGIGRATGALLGLIEDWRRAHGIERIRIVHNVQTRESRARPVSMPLLPLSPTFLRRQAAQPWPSRRLPTLFETRDATLGRLIREHIFVRIYRALAEAQLSEHASRLSAMQSAEGNIRDRLAVMEQEFHNRRQEEITTEILDLIAGSRAITAS